MGVSCAGALKLVGEVCRCHGRHSVAFKYCWRQAQWGRWTDVRVTISVEHKQLSICWDAVAPIGLVPNPKAYTTLMNFVFGTFTTPT